MQHKQKSLNTHFSVKMNLSNDQKYNEKVKTLQCFTLK